MAKTRSKTTDSVQAPQRPLTTYVALLRGINVGGNNKVEMARLRQTFERLGFFNVQTLIASGNVIFRSDEADPTLLAANIEAAIETDFGLKIRVLLKDFQSYCALIEAIPDAWTNDDMMRCDVMLLFPEGDNEDILQQLTINPALEDVRYVPGAVLWRIDRDKVTKSRMAKLIGRPLYQQITIRNVNTVRRLHELMVQCDAQDGA